MIYYYREEDKEDFKRMGEGESERVDRDGLKST
jgi:hypothetical protein